MDYSIFKGRRVLVTDSTGFKGSWLCTWLLHLGADVSGFALTPEPDAPLFDQLNLREQAGNRLSLGGSAAGAVQLRRTQTDLRHQRVGRGELA